MSSPRMPDAFLVVDPNADTEICLKLGSRLTIKTLKAFTSVVSKKENKGAGHISKRYN